MGVDTTPKMVIHSKFMEGILLYNLLVFAVFYAIYHTIDFEKHYRITTGTKPTSSFIMYFAFLTHTNAMCAEVEPKTPLGRNIMGLHVMFSWGLFLVLLAPWSSIPSNSSNHA